MDCGSCGASLPDQAAFCGKCGEKIVVPAPDPALRSTLLECIIHVSTSVELSEWLRGLGQDPKGTVKEKADRVRGHTKYLSMPATAFPQQTIWYLKPFTVDQLADTCEALGLSLDGTKDELFRRIYREVGYREGWLQRPSDAPRAITKALVRPFVDWYPMLKPRDYERDYYDEFEGEMAEVFGEEHVHRQYSVAHGSTLKIDFHIGAPRAPGVGVEFKLPANVGDIQRALGQMDQYSASYGTNLLIVVIPHLLDQAKKAMLAEELRKRDIDHLFKERVA